MAHHVADLRSFESDVGYVSLLLIDQHGFYARTPFAGKNWTLTWDLADSSGKVICSNIHSFKAWKGLWWW